MDNWSFHKTGPATRFIIMDTNKAEAIAMTYGSPDQERHAHLIAAAPQMLAALLAAAVLLEDPEAGDIDPDRVAELVADAVRAATGV